MPFTLYTGEAGDNQVGGMVANSFVSVSEGGFHTSIDFGPGVFTGLIYRLELGVRAAGSGTPFVTLSPPQALGPIPMALHAVEAGTIPDASLAIEKIGPVQVGRSAGDLSDAVRLEAGENIAMSTQDNRMSISATIAQGPEGPQVRKVGNDRLDRFDPRVCKVRKGPWDPRGTRG